MKRSELLKPASALITVTVIVAVLLGYVHTITMEPIAEQQQRAETAAIGAIFKTTPDSSQEIAVPEDSPIKRAVRVYSGGAVLGYAFFTSPVGYGGPVNMVVGIGADGAVQGVRILQHSETPGLGANAANPAFTDQFKGKSGPLKVTKAAPGDNEIQAVTSATITSGAVTKGVNDALLYFSQSLSK